MKKQSDIKEYIAPMLSCRHLGLQGFLCSSDVDTNMFVDEDENMGEEGFIVFDN